ncbi:MAG: hypothetical protein APF80_01635 [Alphaproteobacteria bacterium BRH_c36]|nr:MAG: hypothetical protein APF80_01635 [Alphaproteobacteria bacterium BRH_c36]
MAKMANVPDKTKMPLWIPAFCYALMGPACAINAVFIALAIPAMAGYGIGGLLAAGAIGAVIGILPGLWLARRIHEGLQDDR